MINRESQKTIRTVFIATVVCILLIIALLPLPAHALPPRPNPPADQPSKSDSDETTDAHIVLQVQSAPSGLWTIVQWQDNTGGWHSVEGWQGILDPDNKKSWWVAEKDFGKGPFRWLIYQSHGGSLLTTSESFYLPRLSGETVLVEVSSLP